MIHRTTRGVIPDKPHTVFEVDDKLTYEHCFTRAGFESVYTILWHRQPPHWVELEEELGRHPGWAEGGHSGPLRRSHYMSEKQGAGGSPLLALKLTSEGRQQHLELSPGSEQKGEELLFVYAAEDTLEADRSATGLGLVVFSGTGSVVSWMGA